MLVRKCWDKDAQWGQCTPQSGARFLCSGVAPEKLAIASQQQWTSEMESFTKTGSEIPGTVTHLFQVSSGLETMSSGDH